MNKEQNQITTVALKGLSCQKCVQKLTAALEALPNCENAEVSKKRAKISGNITQAEIEKVVTDLGYQVVKPTELHLQLTGLSCAKCVAKVEKALAEREDIFSYKVTTTQLTLKTTSPTTEIITLINALGYKASTGERQSHHQPPKKAILTGEKAPVHQYILEGMSCASCVKSLEEAIGNVEKVTDVRVNLAERTATVWGEAEPETIITAVQNAGYHASLHDDEQTRRKALEDKENKQYQYFKKNALIALLVGIPLMIIGFLGGSMSVGDTSSQLLWGMVALLTLGLLATVGQYYFSHAWQALKHGRATMDTLVALGTGAAWLYSTAVVLIPTAFPAGARHVYFEATAMILGLITLGHAIETRARAKTSVALNRLIDLQPETAVVVEKDGSEKTIALAQVQTGMTLRLKSGARVPVDGKVITGESYIDESMLTGEPLAVYKTINDSVHAGTVNQTGTLLFTATEIGENTVLARIIALVRQAQTSKPALARLADQVAGIFVPAVIAIAILTAMIWFFFGPAPKINYMLITAVTVLIIACPCALGLATPLSVTIGVGRAAELGVLVRDASALQLGASVDTVVIDKTGTLTAGKPQLTTVFPLKGHQNHLLTVAAALEKPSSHPLAEAILAGAEKITLPDVENFQTLAGKGICGQINNLPVAVGNALMMAEMGITSTAVKNTIQTLSKNGETPVFVAENGELLGVLGISDPLRESSASAVQALQTLGFDIVMLTGDVRETAEVIGKKVGISKIIAGVLPDQKAEEIQKLQQMGKKVAMIGDGINDAPALAQADVGLAMSSGSDIAIESAAFTLMRHSLIGVVDALALSRATLKNMKGNLFGAFIYNAIGIPIAAGILYPWTGTLLSPVLAGAAMALSSITVVSNANRLRLFKSPVQNTV